MLDAEGYVATWNTGAERFKGYSAEEIIGQHFSVFYTDEDRAIGLPGRALATATAEGRFESEGWRIRKDGTRFWTHVVIDPVYGAADEVIGFAKITRDISEKRDRRRVACQRTQVQTSSPGRQRLRYLPPRSERPRHELECRRPGYQGLHRSRDRRPTLLRLLHR
uniref:PAS domain-containing protein n=1 Tax=Tardiphaga alba TaxID=340268 RepID=UPI0038B42207